MFLQQEIHRHTTLEITKSLPQPLPQRKYAKERVSPSFGLRSHLEF
jgi:hypothetical protein